MTNEELISKLSELNPKAKIILVDVDGLELTLKDVEVGKNEIRLRVL